ncbi:hypothetical protein YC2023_019292 [Brassica napus]
MYFFRNLIVRVFSFVWPLFFFFPCSIRLYLTNTSLSPSSSLPHGKFPSGPASPIVPLKIHICFKSLIVKC